MKEMVKKWNLIWNIYYEKINSFSIAGKISLSFLFALITGLSGQIYVKLPFTPVPLTSQVFVVLLSGILLGKNFASLSQIFYFIFGVAGIGWFYSGGAGILRPTNGYIIGFIFSAYFIGKFFNLKKNNPFIPFDIFKAYLAAVVGNSIIRNRRFYEEI